MGFMKAISIKQPWASLIAAGVKTLEIRQWPTDHRGPLLVVSSRRPVIDGHRHGAALCVVDVTGCRRMTPADMPFACISDFYDGHYAWELGRVRLIEPFGVMGQLRLFDVDDRFIKPLAGSATDIAEAAAKSSLPYAAGKRTGRSPSGDTDRIGSS